MNDTDYKTLYYQLAEKELRRLQTLLELSEADQAQFIEYLNHNELGLAFGVLEDAVDNRAKEEATAQIEILGSFLRD